MQAKYAVPFLTAAALVAIAPAAAQTSQTYVSSTGADANSCSRAAPCRTFDGAHAKTIDGGEISCLDSGSFGALAISKSITIDCTAFPSVIQAPAGSVGVFIDTLGVNVVLRGLTISGVTTTNSGFRGIRFNKGDSLTLDQMTITGFRATSAPVSFGLSVQSSLAARVVVTNSKITGNGFGNGGGGIQLAGVGTGYISVTLQNVELTGNNGTGIFLDASSSTGSTSNVSGNNVLITGSNIGAQVLTPAGMPGGTINLVNSFVTGNINAGLVADGANSRIIVADTLIAGNTTGLRSLNSGALGTGGGNKLFGNGTNGAFTGAIPPQ